VSEKGGLLSSSLAGGRPVISLECRIPRSEVKMSNVGGGIVLIFYHFMMLVTKVGEAGRFVP